MTDNFAVSATTGATAQLSGQFRLPALYRIGALGKVRVWFIVFNGSQLMSYWGTEEDYKAGTLQSSPIPILLNASGRTVHEQALLEAQSRWKTKHDKEGYSEQIMSGTILTGGAILANEWKPEKGIKRFPVWVQPKLDGVRCRAHIEYSEEGSQVKVELISRNKMVITHFDHIRREILQLTPYIQKVISEAFPGMYPIFRLDGELYDQRVPFQLLSGMTRTSAAKVISEKEMQVKYHIFDLVVSPPEKELTYDERATLLFRAYSAYITERQAGGESSLCMLNSYSVGSIPEILQKHDEFVQQRYEGLIIRHIGGRTETERKLSYYKRGKSAGLLKYKHFQDSEGLVIGAEQATGDEQGAVIWQLQAKNGAVFWCRPKGAVDHRIEEYKLWISSGGKAFYGQLYRYRYQELTDAGVPRFPRGLGFVYDRSWQEVGSPDGEEEDP